MQAYNFLLFSVLFKSLDIYDMLKGMKNTVLNLLQKPIGFLAKRKKWLIILIVLMAIGFYVKQSFFSNKNGSQLTTVKRDSIKQELTLSGKIEAEEHVVLQFQTLGLVNWVGVKEDDWVLKNQSIASLEKERLEAALRQAWQDFTAAKAESEKYYSGNYTGNAESYDQKIARTALDAAQNKAYDDVRIAQENLKYAILYSPIDGLVVNAYPNHAGVNLSALSPAKYEIVNPETIYLKVTADQTEVVDLKEGKMGQIVFDSYPEEKIEGTIKSISFTPNTDETGTVYTVKVSLTNINNSDYKYRIGMTGDINFTLKEKDSALIIPLNFLKSDNKGKYVLLGKEKKKTYVQTGIESDQDVEITEGLLEGDTVYD